MVSIQTSRNPCNWDCGRWEVEEDVGMGGGSVSEKNGVFYVANRQNRRV